jgi:hypothetical protein
MKWTESLKELEAKAEAWDGDLARAQALIDRHVNEYRAATGPLEQKLWRLIDGRDAMLERFGSIALYPGGVEINRVFFPFTGEVKTLAETRGAINRNKRSLLTRTMYGIPTAGIGFFATKTKKHDDREVVLLVETPEWAEMATFSPALQRDAVRFAKEIERVGNQWVAGEATRRAEAADLARQIKAIQEANAGLLELADQAAAEYAAIEARTEVRDMLADFDQQTKDIDPMVLVARGNTIKGIRDLVEAHDGSNRLPPPPPQAPGQSARTSTGLSKRTVQWRDLRTESLGLMVRRGANDVTRSLGRWNSRRPSPPPAPGDVLDLDGLIASVAAAPAEGPPPAPPAALSTGGADPVEQLERLADLHARGVLTDDEFAAAKQRLLG